MAELQAFGFIGTGVMGEPMCRNLLLKSGRPMQATTCGSGGTGQLRSSGTEEVLL